MNDDVTVVRTVCDPNCHASPRSGLNAFVQSGRILRVEPGEFPDPRYTRRTCGMNCLKQLECQYHSERLLHPLIRDGERGGGKWRRAGWEEALDLISGRLKDVSSRWGKRSVFFYAGSGSQGVLTKGSVVRFSTLFGGTSNKPGGIDYGVPKGLEYTFGVPASTYFGPGGHEMADALNSKMTILWGANQAETRMADFRFIQEAQRRGMKLVSIDPNFTTTASKSDVCIRLRPGTDCALALGMLHTIISESLFDNQFLASHTNAPFLVRGDNGRFLKERDIRRDSKTDKPLVRDGSSLVPHDGALTPNLSGQETVELEGGGSVRCNTVFARVQDLVGGFPPSRSSKITEVPQEDIVSLAREFATSRPSALRVGYGIDRWYYSDYAARAISYLSIFCSYIGAPGGGISVHSGSHSLGLNQRSFRQPRGLNQNLMDLPRMMKAIATGEPYPVKAIWLTCSNLFNQPAANRSVVMREVIPRLEFVVAVDHFMTATAEQADVVLPAATIFEKLDLVPVMYLQLQREVVEPSGEARSDFRIFKMLAEKMGFGEDFRKTEEEYLEEILDTDDPLLQGITMARLKQEGAVLPNRPSAPYVAFADRRFKTASGKVEIYKEDLLPHGGELPRYHEPIEASPENPLMGKYPLTILFSHTRSRIHSTFANLPPSRNEGPSSPTVEMNPADALGRGIRDGDVVRVFNDRGRVKLRCSLNERLRPAVVVISEGTWVKDFLEGDPYGLTHDRVSPTSDNFAYYDCLVQVEKVSQ